MRSELELTIANVLLNLTTILLIILHHIWDTRRERRSAQRKRKARPRRTLPNIPKRR